MFWMWWHCLHTGSCTSTAQTYIYNDYLQSIMLAHLLVGRWEGQCCLIYASMIITALSWKLLVWLTKVCYIGYVGNSFWSKHADETNLLIDWPLITLVWNFKRLRGLELLLLFLVLRDSVGWHAQVRSSILSGNMWLPLSYYQKCAYVCIAFESNVFYQMVISEASRHWWCSM